MGVWLNYLVCLPGVTPAWSSWQVLALVAMEGAGDVVLGDMWQLQMKQQMCFCFLHTSCFLRSCLSASGGSAGEIEVERKAHGIREFRV